MATDNYKHDGAVTIKLSHDNDEIAVWPSVEAPGSVTIALLDSEEPRTNVGIASPAECDALITAIGRALGRPPGGDAVRIVNAIVADLSDRRGLRHEWEAIDDEIREEIKATWMRIVGDGVGVGVQAPTVPRAIGRALEHPSTPRLGSVAEAYNTSLPAGLCVLDAKLDELLRREAARGEQGATVPRAGVASVVANFEANAITADKGEQFGKDTRNAHLEACSKAEAKVWRRAADAVRAATLEAAGLWPVAAPDGER